MAVSSERFTPKLIRVFELSISELINVSWMSDAPYLINN